ncbi:hypothetical protein J6590_094461 [Homalodisca vitripennis]|nr:hypothetical protein J6590_094461 [Homalodisca vitripennis]
MLKNCGILQKQYGCNIKALQAPDTAPTDKFQAEAGNANEMELAVHNEATLSSSQGFSNNSVLERDSVVVDEGIVERQNIQQTDPTAPIKKKLFGTSSWKRKDAMKLWEQNLLSTLTLQRSRHCLFHRGVTFLLTTFEQN